jgi:hypothetical protein
LCALCLALQEEWPLLIIVPASLRLVWAEELEKWLPQLRPSSIHVIEGKEGRVAPPALPLITVRLNWGRSWPLPGYRQHLPLEESLFASGKHAHGSDSMVFSTCSVCKKDLQSCSCVPHADHIFRDDAAAHLRSLQAAGPGQARSRHAHWQAMCRSAGAEVLGESHQMTYCPQAGVGGSCKRAQFRPCNAPCLPQCVPGSCWIATHGIPPLAKQSWLAISENKRHCLCASAALHGRHGLEGDHRGREPPGRWQ